MLNYPIWQSTVHLQYYTFTACSDQIKSKFKVSVSRTEGPKLIGEPQTNKDQSTPFELAKLIRLFVYAGIAWTWPDLDAAGLSAGLIWAEHQVYLLCAAAFTSQSLEASWSAPGEYNRDGEWHPSPRETVLWLYCGLGRGFWLSKAPLFDRPAWFHVQRMILAVGLNYSPVWPKLSGRM